MKCQVCGTFNEDYLEYCENCAAFLVPEPEAEAEPEIVEEPARTAEEIYESRKGWSFVASPAWPKPEFDANTVSEDDIPADFVSASATSLPDLTSVEASSSVSQMAEKVAALKENAEKQATKAVSNDTVRVSKVTSPSAQDTDKNEEVNKPRPLSAVRRPLAVKKPEPVHPVEEKVTEDTIIRTKKVEAPKAEEKPVKHEKVAEPIKKEDVQPKTKSQKVQPVKEEVQPIEEAPNKAQPVKEEKTHSKKERPETVEVADDGFAPDEYDDNYDEYYDEDDRKTFSFGEFFSRLFKRSSAKDDDYDDEDEEYEDEEDNERPIRKYRKTIIVSAISALVVLAVIFLAITIGNNYDGNWGRFFSYTFGGYPLRKPATIETATLNDEPARIITVYTKKGHKVRFMDEVYEVTGDLIQFRVADQLWVPSEPVDAPTVEITPDLTIIAPDGTETPVEFANKIVLQLPTLELNVTTPSVTEIPTSSTFIDFVGSITDLTASVFINDMQVQVDQNGSFSARYSDLVSGTNTLNVEARKNGYQIARKTFTVICGATEGATSTPAPGTVALSFAQGEGKFRTTTDSITITGNMERDAVIAVSGATLVNEIVQDAAAGTFSFQVYTPDIKMYSVNVTAAKNGVAFTKTIYLERAPEDKDAYMDETVALDYNALKSNPSHDAKYVVRAAVSEVVQSDPYFKLRIKTDNGDLIVCYYNNLFKESEFSENAEFKFYGAPHGTDSSTGLPMLHAWYIKKYSNE
ncbi:MAG: hypothetical protein IJO48_00705 [Clostridia bacterium]|nr:hypothetical protein [Clostridia bacterium]